MGFNIGDKVIVMNRGYAHGTIVTNPKKIFSDIYYGVQFDDKDESVFNPYYIHESLLERVKLNEMSDL